VTKTPFVLKKFTIVTGKNNKSHDDAF